MFFFYPQAMAEQLAENYHNAWAKRKKLELESRGTKSQCQQLLYYSSLLSPGPVQSVSHNVFNPFWC